MKAEIITIGDEILLGHTVDTNSAWIAEKLAAQQVFVGQITSITDTQEHILDALRRAAERSDLIVCTGGLGPTRDDITKSSAARYFRSQLTVNNQVLAHVKSIFSKFDRPMPEINQGQALVLSNAKVLFNDWGTAPGMWVAQSGKIYVFLPGVPFEMKNLMIHRVLPLLANAKMHEESIAMRYLLVVGIGESFLAEKIAAIEEAMPIHVHLAYLPQIGLIKLRISVSGTSLELVEQEADVWKERLITAIGSAVVSVEDIDFAEVIIRGFSAMNRTLGLAESCTGGQVAARITAISGASKVFRGALVAYDNDIKEQLLQVHPSSLLQFGAVSEQVVKEMAEGAKEQLQVDYAIATSGIAGPTGGTPTKPVGTVWIAVAGRAHVVTKKFLFHDDRRINIERTVAQALFILWELFQKENPDSPNIVSQ